MDTSNLKAFLPFINSPTDDFCGNSWTASGNPTISNGKLYLNGSSYLQMVNPFVFSGQDFTISLEFNLSVNQSSNEPAFWQLWGSQNYRVQLEIYERNKILLWANGNNVDILASAAVTDGVTHHAEVDYSNSTWRLFLDGQLVGTDTYALPAGNLPLYIGINNRSSAKINGYIDNFVFYDGVALHSSDFTPPSADFYSTFDFNFSFDTCRKISNDVNIQFDTLRKVKQQWRYENYGTADLLTVDGYTFKNDAAKYKSDFYQSARIKCFDIPSTEEIWCKFDVFSENYSYRWRAYNDTGNGYVDGISSYGNKIDFWCSANSSREVFETNNLLTVGTLQTVLLHMISGSTNGIIEAWLDGVFIYTYTGNVNNGYDFNDFYLQSDSAPTTFSNVIISNSQIGLNENVAVDFSAQFDTCRKITLPFSFSAQFDTCRKIALPLTFNVDTERKIVKSIDFNLDTSRKVVRSVNLLCDTLRKLPYPFIVAPTYNLLPIDTPQTAGIQSLNINILAGRLVDQFNFVTSNSVNIMEQVKGQYLDYKFNFRVENTSERDIFTDLPITSCQCCSDIDSLFYTQIAYKLQKITWTDGGVFAKKYTDKLDDNDQTTFNGVRRKKTTTMIEKPLAAASSHISAIAAWLGKTPVLLFDNFTSTVDIQQEGVTYQDLISEIFDWSKRTPHKLINIFLRDDKLFVIQRGHEQNIFDLATATIGNDVNIDKSLVRTSYGVTRETYDIERRRGASTELILGDEITDDEDDDEEDFDDEDDTEPEEPSRNLPTHEQTIENNVVIDVYYTYDEDDNLLKTVTITDSKNPDFASKVIVENSYYKAPNGEKLLSRESTDKYEWNNSKGWVWVEGKVVNHTYTTVGQQHVASVDNEGEIEVSAITNAVRDDRPTPYDDTRNGQLEIEDAKNNWHGGYTYRDGKKYKVVGYETKPNIITGTLEEVKLYDSSFPVDDAKAQQITNDLKWLNRKIQETVSLDVYDFPHVFDFNDIIIFRGNTYHLQANSVIYSHNIINKQSLQLIRWYAQGSTSGGQRWELVHQSTVIS